MGAGRQTSLFSELSSNVIPFESFQRPATKPTAKEVLQSLEAGPAARNLAESKQPNRRQSAGRRAGDGTNDNQGSLELDFLPPAPQTPRTLKTTVNASIYCDAKVAAPMHRSVAAMLDAAMIAIGCGIFVGIFQLAGGGIRANKLDIAVFICSAALITMLYGFVFALTGRETAGQNWTELRLINFDGFPPDGQSRALRFVGSWLGFCACGLGMFWALMDEEYLTWHDHMSKTFLTMREADCPFVRENR
jgi:uncharacterized RDD family membrane protein YckC